ncbi:MAG: DUF2341 domain-containing protein [Verrucomicrobia bacterium]|nr:DUF2341 domain-containing protein [Verrucomicrobiota bacterium]
MKRRMTIKVVFLLAIMAGLTAVHAAPEINNRAGAANVAPGEAKLQGRLDGGGDAEVVVYYGPADGGTNAGAWADKIELKGVKDTTEFFATASKLIFGQTYFYRACASNASGQGWANTSAQFTTLKPRVPATGPDKLPVKAGLVCWFDAAAGVTADAKGVVQTWKDLSGNGHDANLAGGAPVLAQNQIRGKPAVLFRTAAGGCALNLDGPLVSEQQFVVMRSPNAKWNSDGCAFGRRSKRASCYRLGQNSTQFWGDQYPKAVSKDGKKLPETPFNLGTITEYMILKIDVNDNDLSNSTYQIGMADTASCDMDIAEIIAYQTPLSAADEDMVGGYLAAKYGITTAYTANPGMAPAAALTNAPATVAAATSAVLNATLTCPGSVYDVRVFWGTGDGGTDANRWENSAPVKTFTHAAPTKISHTLTGLTPGATYYYTFRGTNAVDSLWANKSLRFMAGGAATASQPPKLLVTKGLACWFDAGSGVTADAKGAVQEWKDLSGANHHAKTGGGVAPALAANQLNSKPALQFRKGWLGIDGTFFAKEHFLVLRSPVPKWSGASGLLGRLKGRGSSYNTYGNDTGFWTDVSPAAVGKNGTDLPGPLFDCSPITQFMVLKIIVNNANETEAAYAIGNNDGLSSGDFDVAEILGYQAILGPRDEALVGGYLAAKYGIDTAYPPLPPAKAAELPAGEMAAMKYQSWKHSGSMFLLTTPDGADLPATALEENFPALVRLSKDWFTFAEAKTNGEDLRFATSAGVPLAYQIDRWDAAAGTALVWVRVPVIKGNARQELRMFWGNADAKSESSGPAVFNRSNGYLSVWHMNEPVQDDAGTVESTDLGTTVCAGVIGSGRQFAGGKGISCGDRITKYPFASSPHTTEAWVNAAKMNTTVVEWGKLGGVTMRLLSTPSRVGVSNNKSNLQGTSVLPKAEWIQVVYTYDGQSDRIYVNGRFDMPAPAASNIEVLTPVRMQIGNGFLGAMDEVRVSNEARSADWVKLQYENQKPLQTLVGPLVQSGTTLAVSNKLVTVPEGKRATVTVKAGGAQKIYWIVRKGDTETVAAVDCFSFTVGSRVTGDESFTLRVKAVYADGVKTLDIPVTIQEDIPEPVFTLKAPATWNGRDPVEVMPEIKNLAALKAKGVGDVRYVWEVTGGVVMKEIAPDRLLLKLSQYTGPITVKATLNNGGADAVATTSINVTEPKSDPWLGRTPGKDEKPEDGQFFARDDKNEGTLYYNGTLGKPADSVFLKVYADDKLIKTETGKPAADNSYALTAKLKAGLIKYKVEFGTKTGATETVVQTVGNLVCGDAWLIDGQSNALALDTGEQSPTDTSEWIRSYGGPTGRGDSSDWVRDRFGNNTKEAPSKRTNLWCSPAWKQLPGSDTALGWWGMDLAKKLLASHQMPICIIQAAVGGTRIDEHKRDEAKPLDLSTMYGKMLWRVRNARLTHGIRGVLWHQGEADQGLDGPDGGYGWETYQQYFVNMSLAWKQDMPNIRHYYVFQIWPNGCGQGGGHGDMLREVQRTLPRLYSNLDVMSTLGIKPPGPCHYPLVGWSEFVRLMQPLIERDTYGRKVPEPITAPDLKQACYTSGAKDAITLEFDQPVIWLDSLAGQFYLDDQKDLVAKGAVSGNVVTLHLKAPATAAKITYLKELNWNQNDLIFGKNGIAALTFCDVPILPEKPRSK